MAAANQQPMLQPTFFYSCSTLPDKCIIHILLLLPVRSLLRFKSVSKSWKILISSPKFTDYHLHFSNTEDDTSITNHQLIFYNSNTILTYYLNQLFENNPPTCAQPVISTSIDLKNYTIKGSCNGLLCLFHKSQKRLRLFNPTTRIKSQISPQLFPLLHNEWDIMRYYGFGYDQINHKYKFLVVMVNSDTCETLTKIYTFGEDSSKTIQNFPCKSDTSPGVYVSGTLNWILNKNKQAVSSHILSFDLSNEICSEVPLPQNDDGKVCRHDKLCVLSNCLSTIVTEKSHWIVWSMTQVGVVESWTKLMIIPQEKFRSLTTFPCADPMFVSENGIVLLRDKANSKFVLYNLNSGELVYPSLSREHPPLFYLPIQRQSLVTPPWLNLPSFT